MATGIEVSVRTSTAPPASPTSRSRSTSASATRSGRSSSAASAGRSSPANPTMTGPCAVTASTAAVRPGCMAMWEPCSKRISTPTACASCRTASSASTRPTRCAGVPGCFGTASPRISTPTWRGCGGMPASSARSVSASGRAAPGGISGEPYATPARGRNTVPVSKIARSVDPRDRLRRAMSTSPGSSERRRYGNATSSGFARRTAGASSRSAAPKRAFCSSDANGDPMTSLSPDAASAIEAWRRRRCAAVRPRPGGATGSTAGIRS